MSLKMNRKVGERVFIDDRVAIKIAGINGNTVRLEFDHPSDTLIVREEIRNAMERSYSSGCSASDENLVQGLYR